jgi:hypothetical protein
MNVYSGIYSVLPNVFVEWFTLLLRIQEAPGSNLGPETGYTDWGFRELPQSLPVNAGIVSQIRP